MDFTLNNLLNTSLNWLFPHQCISCKTSKLPQKATFCDSCYSKLPFRSHGCHQCGQPIAASQDYCGRCLNAPPYFDICFCPFSYQDEIKRLIQDFKYYEQPQLSSALAAMFTKELHDNAIELPQLLIPVPCHISRLRARGYNQSQLLALALSKQLDIPIDLKVIVKNKKTEPQVNQTVKNRRNNLRNCFKMQKTISAKSVAIIDDVVTTGATANEIAKILKKNGVDYIQIWGLSHTE